MKFEEFRNFKIKIWLFPQLLFYKETVNKILNIILQKIKQNYQGKKTM